MDNHLFVVLLQSIGASFPLSLQTLAAPGHAGTEPSGRDGQAGLSSEVTCPVESVSHKMYSLGCHSWAAGVFLLF